MPRLRTPVLHTRALPATVTDLLAQRVVQVKPKLLDEVEQAFLALYDNEQFRALRGEEDPEETVEGSVQDDDTMSAQMIRKQGIDMHLPLISRATLHDIRIKLRGVERRFNASRKLRKKAVVHEAAE